MRTALLLSFGIAIVAASPAAAADTTPPTSVNLCAMAQNPLPVDVGFSAMCTATAECDPFPDQQCDESGTCIGVDRNCSVGERGYVSCGGQTTYCAGSCCAEDGVCEYFDGCGCSDPDCCGLRTCVDAPGCDPCAQNGTCNFSECGCSDPDCSGRPECSSCTICPSITNCTSDEECSQDCPGSICTSTGGCLCAG